eukprot:962755-Rhodomonas_salina.1
MEPEFDWYAEVTKHMDKALRDYEEFGGQKSLHELISLIDPPPNVAVSRSLMGLADDLEPPSEAPTRGNKGATHLKDSSGKSSSLRALWQQLQRDGCQFAGGNVVCARVFPTAEEGAYWLPDK